MKMTSMVQAEEAATKARASGQYVYVGVFKAMKPDERIRFSVQRVQGGEYEDIYDDEEL